jgi:hypothetical protein
MGDELLKSCMELREACAAWMRVVVAHPAAGELITAYELETERIGLKEGFGVRAQEAIRMAVHICDEAEGCFWENEVDVEKEGNGAQQSTRKAR